ncbi:MAG TPA: type II toxin-antitoxin system PemK/MazF family toxin [Candidatus Sulfotelmatobacter sp.]|jgi:mRNA interferase MazF|nr:type II toxin-antitoxin system PemK/MazF family toxin [Candidatus Sulfotelmatobacter sp.]
MSSQRPALPKPVRGDVFSARLDPTEGSEQAGTRPIVVVSRDSINANSPVVVVLPITDAANVKRLYPSHTQLPKGSGGLKMDSVAKAEQIRAIQVSRFVSYFGRLDRDIMARIEEAIRITLVLK